MNIKNLKLLRSILLGVCLAGLLFTMVGCGGSMTETKAERARRWRLVTKSGLGQIADDVDAFLLMDKRSKLSEHIIRDY